MPFQSKPYVRLAIAAAAIVLAIAIVACQSAIPTPKPSGFPTTVPAPVVGTPPSRLQVAPVQGTPGRTLNLKGKFAFVGNDGNLTLEDANTGEVSVLVPTGAQGYAQNPAFSPDGKQVAYSYSSFTKDGQVQSQIRVIDVETKADRVLVSPQDLKITVDLPAYSPDGRDVYITQIIPVGQGSQRTEIDIVSASGGSLTKVMDDGFEAVLSPDGKKMTFQRIDFTTYTASLWVANVDGSGARQLLDKDSFAAVFGMRFSPDMQTIVFAASGPAKKKLPGVVANVGNSRQRFATPQVLICLCKSWGRGRAGTSSAQNISWDAHGLPWDLWLVNLDGTKFERLTSIGADSPVPVWSTDGKYIAFFEATGIYLLDRDNKTIYSVSGIGGYGGFDWR
jgi:Tol biopolymer transport system component